jgi:hypothetical protein
MSRNQVQADNIVNAIDLFVCSQLPNASEVTFSYGLDPESDWTEYFVRLNSVYQNDTNKSVAGRGDLHSEAVEKMEAYLASSLNTILASRYVLNLISENNEGRFGVALRNSVDREENSTASTLVYR